jgi:TonB family protein
VWVAAACLLLAGCLGLWWHHRPAADRSAAPALPAHAAPVTAAENPPTEVADLHATSHGSEAAAGGAPSARKNSPNRPAKPSPLVLRTAPPAAAAVRPITPVHLGTSVAPPSAATDWAAATPSSQPNPLPRRRVATPAQPKAAPNPLADSAPAEATAANGGNGTATAPHGGYVRPTSLGTMAANVMYSPAPAYPAAASAAHVQGEVRLEAEVDPDGNVASTRVISGPPLLRDAAADAVQHWRYRPYLYDGKPVAMNALVVMDFHLP